MKTLSFFFPLLMAFGFLQDASCSDKKIIKQEFTAEQISLLKEQPSCLQREIVKSYEKKGDLKDIDLTKSMVDNQEVYQLKVGNAIKTVNKDCEEIKVSNVGEMKTNAKQLIGQAVKVKDIEAPKTNDKNNDASDCIEDKMKDFVEKGSSSSVSQLLSFESEGHTFYMFDHGMAVDLPAYVLNEACDTICITGGGRMISAQSKNCPKESPNSRRVIWNKQKGWIR